MYKKVEEDHVSMGQEPFGLSRICHPVQKKAGVMKSVSMKIQQNINEPMYYSIAGMMFILRDTLSLWTW